MVFDLDEKNYGRNSASLNFPLGPWPMPLELLIFLVMPSLFPTKLILLSNSYSKPISSLLSITHTIIQEYGRRLPLILTKGGR